MNRKLASYLNVPKQTKHCLSLTIFIGLLRKSEILRLHIVLIFPRVLLPLVSVDQWKQKAHSTLNSFIKLMVDSFINCMAETLQRSSEVTSRHARKRREPLATLDAIVLPKH